MEIVFGKLWFKEKQKLLLWLLNTPLVKIWFRWVMRIRKCDLPRNTRILEIGPNYFTHSAKRKGDKIELQTSFRSNEKYARRLWFAFEPLWWMLHAWDMVTKPWLVLNLGFDTLPTKYSTPGSTVSGHAGRVGVDELLVIIRAGAGTTSAYDSGSGGIYTEIIASATTNKFSSLYKGIFLFDTSALGATSTVTAANLGLYFTSSLTNLGEADFDIVSSTPASNTVLADSDFSNVGGTPFSSIARASLTTSAYNTFSLDANGISNISKTGISKFGSRLSWDTDNSFGGTWGSGLVLRMRASDGGVAGTTQDPKIDITYTLPATSYMGLLLMGVG